MCCCIDRLEKQNNVWPFTPRGEAYRADRIGKMKVARLGGAVYEVPKGMPVHVCILVRVPPACVHA